MDYQSQTHIDALSVGRFVEIVNILAKTLTVEESDVLREGVDKAIKTILYPTLNFIYINIYKRSIIIY